jgi:threonine dehydrogenase-like Zn-dependent dehydrogenase
MKALVYNPTPLNWLTCLWLKRIWSGCLTSPVAGLALKDIEPPELPGPDWVRVRTLLGGICGTDLAILAQKQPPNSILQAFSSLPMLMGHENVAVVEEVGSAVDDSWVGRRVCVDPALTCEVRGIDPPCDRCRAGETGACERFGADSEGAAALPPGTSIGYNSRTGGSYGEGFVAHISQLVPVPETITDERAVLTDPFACGLHAALRADLSQAESVLVYGSGVIGLGVIAGLRATGYTGRIDALDRCDYIKPFALEVGANEYLQLPADRRERFARIAERTGATIHEARFRSMMLSGGYDVVFECAGAVQSLNECLKWTRARGQVVLVGTGRGGGVDLTPIWFRELSVVGAYGRQIEQADGRRVSTYQLAHELMTAGKLKTAGILTHTFPLADYRSAFDVAMHKPAHKAVKVAFDFR